MKKKPTTILSWSGGKDSALCLNELMKTGTEVGGLLTTITESQQRISMHGVRMSLLESQCRSLKLPLHKVYLPEMPPMKTYENRMIKAFQEIKLQGTQQLAFGDIHLEDLRKYREKLMENSGMEPIFPIWKREPAKLVRQFIDDGFKAVIVCVNSKVLEKSYLGRTLDHELIDSLPPNVDPNGENGEYHTFVFDGPVFRNPLQYRQGEIIFRDYQKKNGEKINYDAGFWYLDLMEA